MWTHILIQAVGEFLPISSTACARAAAFLCGLQTATHEMGVALHFGSLVALIVHFRRELKEMIASVCMWLRRSGKSTKSKDATAKLAQVIVATIPVVVLGGLARNFVREFDSMSVIGTATIVFGLILYLADRFSQSRRNARITMLDAFVIGLFQAIAIFPGVSRLGITITAARMLGIDRARAVHFGMLLAIPAITGAVVLEGIKAIRERASLGTDMIYGMLATAAIGVFLIKACERILVRLGFGWIAAVRVLIGGALRFLTG